MKKLFFYALCIIFMQSMHTISDKYPLIVEKLVFFKNDKFKAFYGGPIDGAENGARWLMPIAFENDNHKTRAAYEVIFINCSLHDAQDAEILFVDVSDINIKFKNTLSPDYEIFSSLLHGEHKDGKYIIVRFCDIANIYYPDIFIFSESGRRDAADKASIANFLHDQFNTQAMYKDFYLGTTEESVVLDNDEDKIFNPISIEINFAGTLYPFTVTKIIKKNDTWKMYYIVSKGIKDLYANNNADCFNVRIDSGCVSGQICNDQACDCLDQLHDALKKIALDDSPNGIIIHIPTQDGRGFGTAPKAETEIYKRGGDGRIHATIPMDTISAAKLLYSVDKYDLRSYEGAAQVLKTMNIKKVALITDNIEKVSILERTGIEVVREKTGTNKASCLEHIEAKKESPQYFKE